MSYFFIVMLSNLPTVSEILIFSGAPLQSKAIPDDYRLVKLHSRTVFPMIVERLPFDDSHQMAVIVIFTGSVL